MAFDHQAVVRCSTVVLGYICVWWGKEEWDYRIWQKCHVLDRGPIRDHPTWAPPSFGWIAAEGIVAAAAWSLSWGGLSLPLLPLPLPPLLPLAALLLLPLGAPLSMQARGRGKIFIDISHKPKSCNPKEKPPPPPCQAKNFKPKYTHPPVPGAGV